MGSINRNRNNSRYFRFSNFDDLARFIILYKDMFVPYSDYICKTEPVNRDGEVINGHFVKSDNYGKVDENMEWMLEQGYRIYDDFKTVKVNLFPEDLEKILSSCSFNKVKERRNVYYYEFKVA